MKTIKTTSDVGVLFAEIVAPPMNLLVLPGAAGQERVLEPSSVSVPCWPEGISLARPPNAREPGRRRRALFPNRNPQSRASDARAHRAFPPSSRTAAPPVLAPRRAASGAEWRGLVLARRQPCRLFTILPTTRRVAVTAARPARPRRQGDLGPPKINPRSLCAARRIVGRCCALTCFHTRDETTLATYAADRSMHDAGPGLSPEGPRELGNRVGSRAPISAR